MSESILNQIFPAAKVDIISVNTVYHFSIKLIRLDELGVQLLFTDGLSDRKQLVSEQFKDYERVELFFLLPDFFAVDPNSWPVYWLNKIAEVPQRFDTWFGPGDTIPTGSPPKNIAPDFQAGHFILSKPMELEEQFSKITGTKFLSVIPIFQTELDFKLRNSGTALLMKLQKKGKTDKVDMFRTAVCRKRILGF